MLDRVHNKAPLGMYSSMPMEEKKKTEAVRGQKARKRYMRFLQQAPESRASR